MEEGDDRTRGLVELFVDGGLVVVVVALFAVDANPGGAAGRMGRPEIPAASVGSRGLLHGGRVEAEEL